LDFYDTFLGENNDNSEILNSYTLLDNICELFPHDTNRAQLQSLYETKNPIVYQLFKEFIIFEVSDKKSNDHLELVTKVLKKIKSL
jgi:hypothetical protein